MPIRVFAWAALIAGCLVSLIYFPAFAESLESPAGNVIPWKDFALGVGGLLIAMLGAYAKGLESRVASAEKTLKQLNDDVLGEHWDKAETAQAVKDAIKPLEVQVTALQRSTDALHSRLDRAAITRAPQPAFQDDGA
jgi:hypothetical protein